MAKLTNYRCTTTNSVINIMDWREVIVPGSVPMVFIQEWLLKNKNGLVGGFAVEANSIRFQKEEDVMFFKLSTA